MPYRCQEADEGAPGVPDEVGRRGTHHPQERDQVVHVREHLVVRAWLDVLVGPCVAAAVGDRAVGGTDRRELLLPGAQIAGAAVDEDDGLALALLAVRKRGSVDCCGPHPPERTGAHPAVLDAATTLGRARRGRTGGRARPRCFCRCFGGVHGVARHGGSFGFGSVADTLAHNGPFGHVSVRGRGGRASRGSCRSRRLLVLWKRPTCPAFGWK